MTTITPVIDASVPAAAASIIASVCADLGAALAAPVTVKIGFSFGTVAGQAIPAGEAAASLFPMTGPFAWSGPTGISGYLHALAAANPGTSFAAFVGHLPAADPGNGAWQIPYSLGSLFGWSTGALAAGYVGFKVANTVWSFSAPPPLGAFDFRGAVYHEVSEVLGRTSGAGKGAAYLMPFDLARYSAPGVLPGLAYGAPSYFSTDGGATSLKAFNAGPGGDVADWATSAVKDACDVTFARGKVLPWSATDALTLDALGWNCPAVLA